ncbi:S8 family peptidase [Hyphobacterium marinum]|uniref:S8 family serine peptidase n=1 Tax=Hyphobacterium marinum TaxID=3116574 RepID=A0ABU7LZ01_9PROT|nr:S8 family serine peptidase [Hyphobacterium sp. Y6023]MEE2566769.1 S8 family serine peptidase [Hyphobacterium sp. Y6023]
MKPISLPILLAAALCLPATGVAADPADRTASPIPRTGLAGTEEGGPLRAPDGRQVLLVALQPDALAADTRQDALFDRLEDVAGPGITVVQRFRYVPAVLVMASDAEAVRLRADPRVRSVHPELLADETLASGVPITQAPAMWSNGIEGHGRSIAILDSGVDQSHPAFAGRIRDSACFGAPIAGYEDSFYSLCANGTTRDTGSENAGDARLCEGFRQCEHGTLVAGAALGQGGPVNGDGVARGADLVVVQTKAGYTGDVCADGIRCRSGTISDLMLALEWLYDERDRLDLAAINMSVGFYRADAASGECGDHPMEVIVRLLRDAGVAVTAANGNDGESLQHFPPCLPSTIDVGATDDFDRVASFSNNSAAVELMAPGVDLTLPAPEFYAESGYFTGAGTSAAAPMVAGAFTLLAQAHPRATIEQRLDVLQTTGRQVIDVRLDQDGVPFNVIRPRINIADAATSLDTVFRYGPRLGAAVLPQMRSIGPGGTATAFATLVNASEYPATQCRITPPAHFEGVFSFTRTDPATNAVMGVENAPVDIPAGGSASFVFAMTPSAEYDSMEMTLNFRCDGGFGAPGIRGVNRFILSADNQAVPDLAAVSATLSGDGIVRSTVGGATAFAVSAVNIGTADDITVSVTDGGRDLGASIDICPTDPATGACSAPRAATATRSLATNTVGTYSIFVQTPDAIDFDPARNRLSVEFRDTGGGLRGATSVAIRAD